MASTGGTVRRRKALTHPTSTFRFLRERPRAIRHVGPTAVSLSRRPANRSGRLLKVLQNLRNDRFVTQAGRQNPPHVFHYEHRRAVDGEDAEGFAVEVDAVVVGVDAADAGAADDGVGLGGGRRSGSTKAEGGKRITGLIPLRLPLSAFRLASPRPPGPAKRSRTGSMAVQSPESRVESQRSEIRSQRSHRGAYRMHSRVGRAAGGRSRSSPAGVTPRRVIGRDPLRCA